MTGSTLARSYLVKARSHLEILPVLLDDESYLDVVREAHEIMEDRAKHLAFLMATRSGRMSTR